jgi:hypothetical protein
LRHVLNRGNRKLLLLLLNACSNVERNVEYVNVYVEERKYLFYYCFFGTGIQHLAIVNVIISLSALLNVIVLIDLGYFVERYDELFGIYYELKGVRVLCNTAWRATVYVNPNEIDNESLVLRYYAHHVELLCQMFVIRNCTGCDRVSNDARGLN